MRYARDMAIDRQHPIHPQTYHCVRCAHDWIPRSAEYPRQCPRCRSAYWDRPRTHPQRRPKRLQRGRRPTTDRA
jgi:hypothetical protein